MKSSLKEVSPLSRQGNPMLVKEAILENFMSYEYARVSFKNGVNIICGPNGSGKSSLLLGISVALGQTYTERSKKLSDLIRRGKDAGRVTIVLDNSQKGENRPVPRIRKDSIRLTRNLRKDGKYWFEVENRVAARNEINSLLAKFGVDPDNMLIIMHQNMVQEFTVLSNQEKLRIVEGAVGLEPYRQNVLNAQRKLNMISSEEESLNSLLKSAEQTLVYWREQYDRFQEKKQLKIKRRFLERELEWTRISEKERELSNLEGQIQERKDEISGIKKQIETENNLLDEFRKELEQIKDEIRSILEERLNLGYETGKHESIIQMANQNLEEIVMWTEAYQKGVEEYINEFVNGNKKTKKKKLESSKSREVFNNLMKVGIHPLFVKKEEELKDKKEISTQQLTRLANRNSEIQTNKTEQDSEREKIDQSILNSEIKKALFLYQIESLEAELKMHDKTLMHAQGDLRNSMNRAELEHGSRIASLKSGEEILDEIRVTDGHLAALADISEDVERMYESYSKLYLEMKDKARLVAENRKKALQEIKTRTEAWKRVIHDLLVQVNLRYHTILSEAQATGNVRITDDHDIAASGLEILVGFRRTEPVPLNAYTQSGGERSTATMAFLLALQQNVRSPFRAVDEFDIHMDPRNREAIVNVLISAVRGSNEQYIAITPNQIPLMEEEAHIITVQNIGGTSTTRETA